MSTEVVETAETTTEKDRKRNALAWLGAERSKSLNKIDPERLTVIGIDIRPGQTKPDGPEHIHYDKRVKLPLDEGMIVGMMTEGVRVPVEIIRDGQLGIVKDGRRRTLHLREANKRLIAKGLDPKPIEFLVQQESAENAAWISVLLNEHRKADNDMTRAEKAVALLKNHNIEKVALAFNVTPATIKGWQRLCIMSKAVRNAVEADQIKVSAALQWKDMSDEDQGKALAALLEAGGGAKITVVAAKKERKARERGEGTGEGEKGGDGTVKGPSKVEIRKLAKWFEAGAPGKSQSVNFDKHFILGIAMAASAESLPGVLSVFNAVTVLIEAHPKAVDASLYQAIRWAAGDFSTRPIGGLTEALKLSKQKIKAEEEAAEE